jgi:hypothetical protein
MALFLGPLTLAVDRYMTIQLAAAAHLQRTPQVTTKSGRMMAPGIRSRARPLPDCLQLADVGWLVVAMLMTLARKTAHGGQAQRYALLAVG